MYTHRVTSLLFLALVACGSLAVWAQKPACLPGDITTSSGRVCGTTSSSSIDIQGEKKTFTASAYLGIPYAKALRWQNPVAPDPWSTPFQATQFGNECPQSATITQQGVCSFKTSNQSEDCLDLNVWTPAGATPALKLPVLVFIHGGAFITGTGGASTSDLYNGTYLAASQNVVVVTFNYRLGVLGFLAQGGKYNFGFADQILALNWVQKNIESFGGNPHNVTLFGESAGAMSVGLHALSSPMSTGLFQAGIMESNPLGLPYKTASEAQELSSAFCSSRRPSPCTTTTSACDLIAAQEAFTSAPENVLTFLNMPDALMWAPTVDNIYVTGQPMASASNLSVPLILGTNRDEGTAFVYLAKAKTKLINYDLVLDKLFGPSNKKNIRSRLRYRCNILFGCDDQLANVITDYMFTCANRHLAIQATQGANPQPLYLYQFNQVSSFNFWSSPPLPLQMSVSKCDRLVCHADELPYVFNTAGQLGFTFNLQEERLAQKVGEYWTSFARSHNPGGTWPLFKPNGTKLLLSESPSTKDDSLDVTADCAAFWDGIGYENSQIQTRLISLLKTLKKKDSH